MKNYFKNSSGSQIKDTLFVTIINDGNLEWEVYKGSFKCVEEHSNLFFEEIFIQEEVYPAHELNLVLSFPRIEHNKAKGNCFTTIQLFYKNIEYNAITINFKKDFDMFGNNYDNEEQSNEKVEKIIPLVNSNFSLLPTIIMTFDDDDCIIDENLYDKLKEELSEIIDKKYFSIIEIQRGSTITKIVLLNFLAEIGIRASINNNNSEEINTVIKKIENKKFVSLGNINPTNLKYNIPDYTKEDNRKKLVKFLRESKANEDILKAASTIKDEDFDRIIDSTINNISNQIIMQEINQKKYVLNNLEKFNNQIESIFEEKKKESIFEFSITGISLIDRNKQDYENNKKNCNNVITKFLFHGTSTDISTLITITNFKKANVAYFGPGIYMTDMLDYAGFYSYESEDKFINHQRIRKVDESFSIVEVKFIIIIQNLRIVMKCVKIKKFKKKVLDMLMLMLKGILYHKIKLEKKDIKNLLEQNLLFLARNKYFLYML